MTHCDIGHRIEDLDTPVLLLDRVTCDRNIARMAEFFRGRSCQLRPHFKNHKCTALARRQFDAGAVVGMTCAKLGEAEVLVERGFDNVLIANQVVGERKMKRLADLATRATVRVAMDDIAHARMISDAAQAAGSVVGLLIEVDVGMGRCGVPPGEPALQLAKAFADLEGNGVTFWGLQAYEGHLPFVFDFAERTRLTQEAMGQAIETRQLLEDHGIQVQGISGGSSSTYKITGLIEGMTELQSGSYVTMDWSYQQAIPEFEIAMTILASVISRPKPEVAVMDVGLKGVGSEFGPPKIKNHPDVQVPSFRSEEHLIVHNVPDWRVGDVVEVIPSHSCTTSNLYRQMHVHEGGQVVDVWPIEGAGKLA